MPNGNGRPLLTNAVTALMSIFGTIFVLWMTVGGKYVSLDDVRKEMEASSPYIRERASLWAMLQSTVKANEQLTVDIKQIVREVSTIREAQGVANQTLSDIKARLK